MTDNRTCPKPLTTAIPRRKARRVKFTLGEHDAIHVGNLRLRAVKARGKGYRVIVTLDLPAETTATVERSTKPQPKDSQ